MTSIRKWLDRWLLVIALAAMLVGLGVLARQVSGQGIVIPNTFSNGSTADARQVNANFAALAANAVNRTGGTMVGTLSTRLVRPSTDATYDVGDSAHHYVNGYFSGTVHMGACDGCSGGEAVPAGTVILFDGASCPTGFAELTAARGRYLVGVPSGGTHGGTAGTALSDLENRATGQHSHGVTDPGHAHASGNFGSANAAAGADVNALSGGGTTGTSTTGLTVDAAGSVAGTNAPYLQLLVCKKS